MQFRSPLPMFLAAAALVAAATVPQPAAATRVVASAPAICQGALPAFETQLRKRPLAIQNEGTASAFVTCAFNNPGTNSGGSRISTVTIHLQNSASARTVSCTAVNTVAGASSAGALYATRSVRVPRDAAGSTALEFVPADFEQGAFLLPGDAVSVSCSLAPGMGITGTVLLNNAN